jgi:hypothetical protein
MEEQKGEQVDYCVCFGLHNMIFFRFKTELLAALFLVGNPARLHLSNLISVDLSGNKFGLVLQLSWITKSIFVVECIYVSLFAYLNKKLIVFLMIFLHQPEILVKMLFELNANRPISSHRCLQGPRLYFWGASHKKASV